MFDEPCARRTIFVSFRKAALELWGQEGLHDIREAMTPECREACLDPVVIGPAMLPERFVLEWYTAAFEGPAGRDRSAYCAFIDRMLDYGFGRVRRFMLGVASPEVVARKSAELWRHDHSHGKLELVEALPNNYLMRLSDHPYTETPLARASTAEILRHVASLARARNVTSQHRLIDGALEVRVRWE